MAKRRKLTRREVLKLGGAAGAATALGCLGADTKQAKALACFDTVPVSVHTANDTGCPVDADLLPVSPFILEPFKDPLVVPTALRPGYRNPDGSVASVATWAVRQKNGVFGNFVSPPGPGPGNQDSIGDRPAFNDGKTYTFVNPKTGALTTKTLNFGGARAGTHQLFPGGLGVSYPRLTGQAKGAFDLLDAVPIRYHVRLQVAPHTFTTSDVRPIDGTGSFIPLPAGAPSTEGSAPGAYKLRPSTIYGYNGTFPGPRINLEYGRPAIVRFENDLDLNPQCLNRQDFGSPDWAFLAHLANGHSAPESDGQPNHMQDNGGGYQPGQWCDNLYLGYAAGGLDSEKQSFLWIHDLRLDHASANVYKGMVAVAPHYDPPIAENPTGVDGGDEQTGLRLPGVRVDNGDGTFDVKYDVPLVLSDCRLDDGVTLHQDTHQPLTPQPWVGSVCGETHPEWWGQLFHAHYPNHGFVGDIMTVNGTAFPVFHVDRRRYRIRLLDASLSRQYVLSLRQGTPHPAPGSQGQWTFGTRLPLGEVAFDVGSQCMKMTQIASDGGLLQHPVLLDEVEVWPSQRRELVVDFSRYMDGKETRQGDVVYLTNTAVMPDGRKMTSRDGWAVPLVAFVIGQPAQDDSDPGLSPIPIDAKHLGAKDVPFNPDKVLRPRSTAPGIGDPTFPENMDFTLQRGSPRGETEWLINGLQFDPLNPVWAPNLGAFETWGVNHGGGGWTHPFVAHGEEVQVTFRSLGALAASDRADGVALEASESTHVYRAFRTFLGNYVGRSANLVHGDHRQMFGLAVTL